ncbi:hypothetical protein HAX54_043815 [Datura stramonium]|uniref:Uncharacterized protein n=1 Tax=Datura stramonium TaxID=4076 RepID=A0ABS8RNZ1_DATST|nr:hypothetical protein [Datura stramonium]
MSSAKTIKKELKSLYENVAYFVLEGGCYGVSFISLRIEVQEWKSLDCTVLSHECFGCGNGCTHFWGQLMTYLKGRVTHFAGHGDATRGDGDDEADNPIVLFHMPSLASHFNHTSSMIINFVSQS